MIRFLVAGLALAVFLTPPAFAELSYVPLNIDPGITEDPNHKGWEYDREYDETFPVVWKDVSARCEACAPTAQAYNDAMRQLLYTRFWISYIEGEQQLRNRLDEWERSKEKRWADDGQGLSERQEKEAAAALSLRMGLEDLASKLPALRAQEESLKALADDLRAQLQECEARLCQKNDGGGNNNAQQAGGGKYTPVTPLPFEWAGPYPAVCHKCAKLAERLNALPGIAREVMASLERARSDLMFAEAEILVLQMYHDDIILTIGDEPVERAEQRKQRDDKDIRKELEKMERKKAQAERDIAKFESDLDKVARNFEETLRLYEDCVPTCPKQTGMADPEPKEQYAVGGSVSTFSDKCFAGLNYGESFTLGPNNVYGTGAQMKNKAKDMATGAAMGALNNVLGGSGISLGGGGGGDGGSEGPKLDKNPLESEPYKFEWSGFYVGMNAGYGFGDSNNLLVNQEILESPGGDSTFHAMWLEDMNGRRILPSRYYIYDIYRDHKLTVWWTYDHWTNGVHDAHDEGQEVTTWREDVGSFKLRFGGDEGIRNSIWYQSGFDTAVKGVRSVGAEFPVSPGDLTGCGLNLVTHLTLPGKDPVITAPVFVNLRLEDDPAEELHRRRFLYTIPPF